MMLPIQAIVDWKFKMDSLSHDAIKRELADLKTERNYSVITKAPDWVIRKDDKRIKKLERKLNQGRKI